MQIQEQDHMHPGAGGREIGRGAERRVWAPWRRALSPVTVAPGAVAPGTVDAPFTGRNGGSRRAACRPYSFAALMAASMILLWIQ